MEQEDNRILELNVQCVTITAYSQYQNKLLMKLLAYLQQDIKDAISQQRKEGVNQLTFKAEELESGLRHRTLPLSELESNKGHYSRAKLALQDMAQKRMWIPKYKKKGLMEMINTNPLFSVDFEKRGNRIHVNLHFCVETLKHYLSTHLGYHAISLDKLFLFQRNATRQMYRLYLGRFALGYTIMRCGGLAQIIGCGKKYMNLKSIKAELLDPACKEMKKAFFQKQSDIHFDYALSRNQDSQESHLKKLIFTFHTAEDEHLSASRQSELTDYQTKLWFLLKNTWGVKDEVARNISQRVKLWMRFELDDLLQRKQWRVNDLKAKQKPMKNPAGYIVKHLGDFLSEKERMTHQQEPKQGKGLPRTSPASLFPENNEQKA